MPTKTKKKPAMLSTAIRGAIEKIVHGLPNNEAYNHRRRHQDCDSIEAAVDIFLHGVVKEVVIVMFDKTPMMRADIRHQGITHRVNKSEPLRHLIARQLNGSPLSELYCEKILPFLPQDEVALKIADIENAAAAALQDPDKTGPIHVRLAAKKAAEKERLTAKIREVFRGHDNLVSEEEILTMWRETMCAEVMDS